MPSQQQNITNIPSNRVEFIDSRTGLVSREWYRFFLNLFNLSGAGGNQTSLDDLQVGPLPSESNGASGTGTVTSVDVSGGTTGLTTSGGPVTTSGTITLAGTLNVANGGTGVTTSTGTGSTVLNTSPTLITPVLGAATATSLNIGTLTYTPANALISSQSSATTYNQVILQNSNTGTTASADFIVNNSNSTDTTYYGDFGMNSSGFTGSGAFNQPNNVYLTATTADLAIGTTTSNPIHFVTNGSATDAMTIGTANQIAFNGSYGTSGQVLTSAGTGAPPTWTTPTTGTVTSVTGTSPVVSSGGTTPAISLASGYGDTQNPYASKTANYFLAAPNGSSGVPTFRAMVAADVPTLNQNTTGTASNVTGIVAVANGGTGLSTTPANGALDIGNGTGFTRTTLTAGTNVSITNASGSITINSTNPGGTVTSVAASVPSFLSVTGSPITSSGTLAISYSGTALPIANGGTGQTSFTANYIPYGSFSTSASLQFDGTTMRVGSNALLGGTTNPIVGVTGAANNYIQSYIYNATNGASSSADFVAYASNSTDAHGWADMGFTGPSYADATYTVTGPNEAYVFGSALNSTYTGNLVFATDSTGSANAHQFYVGGFTQAKSAWRAQITSTLFQVKGAWQIMGSSSGYVGFQAAAAAGSTTYTLPSADGTTGQALVTNGSGTLSWATPAGGSNITAQGLWENNATISANYSVTSGNNAMSSGPISIASGVTVTVPSGSTWVVV